MRRTVLWILSTVSVLVLLFGYHTFDVRTARVREPRRGHLGRRAVRRRGWPVRAWRLGEPVLGGWRLVGRLVGRLVEHQADDVDRHR